MAKLPPDRSAFDRMFPLKLRIQKLNPWEANERNLSLDRSHWIYTAEFVTNSRYGRLTATPGQITDFASVPWWIKRWIDDDAPDIVEAACGHDTGWFNKLTDEGHQLTLSEVNDILIDGTKVLGMGAIKRTAVRAAVDWYGRQTKWPNVSPRAATKELDNETKGRVG